jgi:hypothetical protein
MWPLAENPDSPFSEKINNSRAFARLLGLSELVLQSGPPDGKNSA